MKKETLFKGTFILSLSLMMTKIIGLVYIIPYYALIGGKDNMILINYAYNYYVLLLEVASGGIPLAFSKLISKYNEQKNYEKSKQIAKVGSFFLLSAGFLGFLLFIFGSEYMAEATLSKVSTNLRYSVEELSLVIRTLSLAVPIVLICAGIKGIFQAHEIMTPTAVTEFVEQAVRIGSMLVSTYVILQVTNGNVVYANAAATGSATVGAIFALIILAYYYIKYKNNLDFNRKNSVVHKKESSLAILKEIFSIAIPFVIVGTFFSVITLIDQTSVIPAMDKLGKAQVAEDQFNVYNNYVNKLVLIAVALAPAFTGAFLPAITRLYTNKNIPELRKQINKLLLALFMIVIPALVAMYILAEPLYTIFYQYDTDGFYFMRVYLPLALCYAMYGIISIVMQAIDKQKLNVLIISIGVIFKYTLNEIFVLNFETVGAIYCSILTYILMITISLIVIHFEIGLELSSLLINFTRIIVASLMMFIIVAAIFDSIYFFVDIENKISDAIIVAISGVIGAPLYFYVLNKLKFMRYVFERDLSPIQLLRRR